MPTSDHAHTPATVREAVMSAPGLHHRKPHLVSSELPGKALTHGGRSACVVLCWPDGHWNPPSPNSSYHVTTIAPAAPPPTTTVHSTCAPSLQPPKATAPSFSLQTGRHRHYTNAFSYTRYTPPERGSAAPGRSPYNYRSRNGLELRREP